MRRLIASAVIALAGLGFVPSSAQAAAHLVVAHSPNRYANPVVVVVDRNQPTTFVNLDLARHDVVARSATRADSSAAWCTNYATGSCPLFWTPLLDEPGAVVVPFRPGPDRDLRLQ